MTPNPLRASTWLAAAIASTALGTAASQDASPAVTTGDVFAAPVRLAAGDAFMGQKRMYPSPTFHDMNGDGLADIVVGDLIGKLTVALRRPGDGVPTYAAETKLKAVDGKDIDFNNW